MSEKNPFQDILDTYGKGSGNYSDFDFSQLLREFTKVKADRNGDGTANAYDWKKAYETVSEDFNSFRRRTEISKSYERKNLTKEIIAGFLEIIDFILYTHKAKMVADTYTKEDDMVLGKVFAFIAKYGVLPMKDMTGQPFDHRYHEAVMTDNSGMFEEGTVTMTLSNGYTIDGEVLRYAKVAVAGPATGVSETAVK